MSAAHDSHHDDTTTGPKIVAEHTSTAGKVVRSVMVERPTAARRDVPGRERQGLRDHVEALRAQPVHAAPLEGSACPRRCADRCVFVEERDRDRPVPGGEGHLPGALPRPAPPDAARRRRGPLRRVHVLPDRVPGTLHHDHPGRERLQGDREAPRGVRDRRASLRGVRPVCRGVPVRRDPDGHRRCTPGRSRIAAMRSRPRTR